MHPLAPRVPTTKSSDSQRADAADQGAVRPRRPFITAPTSSNPVIQRVRVEVGKDSFVETDYLSHKEIRSHMDRLRPMAESAGHFPSRASIAIMALFKASQDRRNLSDHALNSEIQQLNNQIGGPSAHRDYETHLRKKLAPLMAERSHRQAQAIIAQQNRAQQARAQQALAARAQQAPPANLPVPPSQQQNDSNGPSNAFQRRGPMRQSYISSTGGLTLQPPQPPRPKPQLPLPHP
ncbi:MAG: hypothetical protein AAGM22_23700, partial [Acidobacteriota bacterium]